MKFGMVISTDETETVWNAFRFGNISLKSGHQVKVFLINKGVEIDNIRNNLRDDRQDNKHNVKEQVELFIKNKGQILACGTCLKSRQKEGSRICPVSTIKDLLKLVEESDKVLTFG